MKDSDDKTPPGTPRGDSNEDSFKTPERRVKKHADTPPSCGGRNIEDESWLTNLHSEPNKFLQSYSIAKDFEIPSEIEELNDYKNDYSTIAQAAITITVALLGLYFFEVFTIPEEASNLREL